MNLKSVFRIDAVISLLNGLGLLFATTTFVEMANFTATESLVTLGQFLGVTFLFLAILLWRIPDVAGAAMTSLGKLWALGHAMWFVIIGFHILTGAVGGATAYVNIIITGILGILYLTASRKSD